MDDNLAYSDSWRYRDYVIAALNADKPYQRFVEEQLAGDLLADSEPDLRDELLVATGFLAIGPKMLAEDDPVKQQMDIVDEQLDTTCRAFLALTLGCARCHDHKFDPFKISEYYSLAGIFKSTQSMISFRVDSKWNSTGLGGMKAALRLEDLEQIIDRHDNSIVNGNPKRMSADERTAHLKLLEEAKQEYASIPKAMSVAEGKVGDVEIFLRGNHLTPGPVSPRGFPSILAGPNRRLSDPTRSGRLELAHWLTSARQSADCARDREPGVAMALRPGAGSIGRQLRQAGAASLASGAPGLAGDPARCRRLVSQEAPQTHAAIAGLSDEHNLERAGSAARRGKPPALAHAAPADGGGGIARFAAGRQPSTRFEDGRQGAQVRALSRSVRRCGFTPGGPLSVETAERLPPGAAQRPL